MVVFFSSITILIKKLCYNYYIRWLLRPTMRNFFNIIGEINMSYRVKDKNDSVVMDEVETKEEAIKICLGLSGGGTVCEIGFGYTCTEIFSNK